MPSRADIQDNYDLYKEMDARGDFKDGYMPRPKIIDLCIFALYTIHNKEL